MLKAIVLGIAAAGLLAGPALAQAVRPPAAAPAGPLVLVKKDKGENDEGENGHGRKLGHYKHGNGNNWSAVPPGAYGPGWYYVPPTYYVPPGYGSSVPPPYYVAPY